MTRLTLTLPLVAALAAPLPAAAQSGAEDCAAQASIVAAAVERRSAGDAPEAATDAVAGELSGRAAAYAEAVPVIVEWVWSLPEEQLGPDVAESYEAACLAQ